MYKLLLCLMIVACSVAPGCGGWVVFTSDRDGDNEIYMMTTLG